MTRFNLQSADGVTTNVDILTDLIGLGAGSENYTVHQIDGTDGTTGKLVYATFNKIKHSVSEIVAFATANSLTLTAFETGRKGSAAPQNPTGVVNSATQVTISWEKVLGATGYSVRRATNAAFSTGVVDFAFGDVATGAVTGLTTATAYFFKVKAIFGSVSGIYSAAITKTTS